MIGLGQAVPIPGYGPIVLTHDVAPDGSGIEILTVSCPDDYETYKILPKVLEWKSHLGEDRLYGRASFCSDAHLAVYRTDHVLKYTKVVEFLPHGMSQAGFKRQLKG